MLRTTSSRASGRRRNQSLTSPLWPIFLAAIVLTRVVTRDPVRIGHKRIVAIVLNPDADAREHEDGRRDLRAGRLEVGVVRVRFEPADRQEVGLQTDDVA